MSNEQMYNMFDDVSQRFFKIPQVFLTSDKYKKLSNDTKLAYGILEQRLNLSKQNKWYDENGDIFFYYTNEQLMEILNVSKGTLQKIKKELINCNLLSQKRMGLNKPNKLYLKRPVATKKDIYELEKRDNINNQKSHEYMEVQNLDFQKSKNETSGSSKFRQQEVQNLDTNNKDINNKDINNKDINNEKHEYHENHNIHLQYSYDKNDLIREYKTGDLPELLQIYFKKHNENFITTYKNMLLTEHKKKIKEIEESSYLNPELIDDLDLNNIDSELVSLFKRIDGKVLDNNENHETIKPYLRICIRKLFDDIIIKSR